MPPAARPSTLRIVEMVELGADSALLDDAVGLLDRIQADDIVGPTQRWLSSEVAATWRTEAYSRWICAALDGGRMVGAASAELHHHANRHLAELDIVVDHDHRRRGIGTALWLRAGTAARDHGADTVAGYVGQRADAAEVWVRHEAAVADPNLSVTVAAGTPAGRAFVASVGAAQVQTEVMSRLDLPEPGAKPHDPAGTGTLSAILGPLEEQVDRHSGEYAVTTHVGLPPGPLMIGTARLSGRMTTDAPLGQLDVRPDAYSAERLAAGVASNLAAGRMTLWALAVHRATGEVAALTDLLFRPDQPRWADQEDTIVDPPHRGHRLGFAVKAAALRRLVAEHPQVRHVTTWNALENGPMLAVNRVMGYQPVSLISIVQGRL